MGKNIYVRFLNEGCYDYINVKNSSSTISRHNNIIDVLADISINHMPVYFIKVIADMLNKMNDNDDDDVESKYRDFFEGLKILGNIGLIAMDHGNLETEFCISYE